jgi:uncharacterized protein (DUF58 family)
MKEFLKKLHKYEILIRVAIKNRMQGDFSSIFRGSGIEFDDVRSYQYGDDIRSINWTATAKGHDTYVNTFKEEKEKSVFFVLDVSASQEIGSAGLKKIDISKEICGVLMLSAVHESSHIGLICFTDVKESFIKFGKGLRYAYTCISTIVNLKPASLKTNLTQALQFVLNTLHKKSVVIVISDFIDHDYENMLTSLAKKHDLVVIHVADRREGLLPHLGIIPVYDMESARSVWVNTSSDKFRRALNAKFKQTRKNLEDICKKTQSDYLHIHTHEDYVPKLIKLFKIKKATRRS